MNSSLLYIDVGNVLVLVYKILGEYNNLFGVLIIILDNEKVVSLLKMFIFYDEGLIFFMD